MGLLSFIKEAGEKLFGSGEAKAAQEEAAKAPSPENLAKADQAAAEAIKTYIGALGLRAQDLSVAFDGTSGTATLGGTADNQEAREKILVAAGNVAGVSSVVDNMNVATPTPESRYYTVVGGDTLSKIAKEMYGDASKYPTIFEANKPMLKHPDKIYPGQVLRIPPL